MKSLPCSLHSKEIDTPKTIEVGRYYDLEYVSDTSAFLVKNKHYKVFEVINHWKSEQFVYRGEDKIYHRVTKEFINNNFI